MIASARIKVIIRACSFAQATHLIGFIQHNSGKGAMNETAGSEIDTIAHRQPHNITSAQRIIAKPISLLIVYSCRPKTAIHPPNQMNAAAVSGSSPFAPHVGIPRQRPPHQQRPRSPTTAAMKMTGISLQAATTHKAGKSGIGAASSTSHHAKRRSADATLLPAWPAHQAPLNQDPSELSVTWMTQNDLIRAGWA